jgi:hypothetical protein
MVKLARRSRRPDGGRSNHEAREKISRRVSRGLKVDDTSSPQSISMPEAPTSETANSVRDGSKSRQLHSPVVAEENSNLEIEAPFLVQVSIYHIQRHRAHQDQYRPPQRKGR